MIVDSIDIKEEILFGWNHSAAGGSYSAIKMTSLSEGNSVTYCIRPNSSQFGVAIPYDGDDIFESFAGFLMQTDYLGFNDQPVRVIELLTDQEENADLFATICAEFVKPSDRLARTNMPLAFWKQWKELVGNKDTSETVYPVLGELYVLKKMMELGLNPKWTGPSAHTYDLEMPDRFVEVKSSTVRSDMKVTISSENQLKSPDERPLYLAYCQFERQSYGLTINGIADDIVALGYRRDALEANLASLGLPAGKIARNTAFVLHHCYLFLVDEEFPKMTDDSFVGGIKPQGITGYTYTVSLNGINPIDELQVQAL